jgi:hypothetical protein
MMARRPRHWMRWAALLIAVAGIIVGVFAYGPGHVTSGGIDPIEVVTPAFYRRLWTIILSVGDAGVLLILDLLSGVDDE